MLLIILLLWLQISGSVVAMRDPPEEDDELTPSGTMYNNACYSNQDTECYTYRHDTRKCMSPMCGGYWIRLYDEENGQEQEQTECADGTFAEECYVANFDKSCIPEEERTSFFETATVVCGSYLHGVYEYFPEYSNLLIKKLECLLDNGQQNEIECYQMRLDPRDCPSPICGGYLLSSSSGEPMIACPDGILAESCYVAAIDYSCQASLEEESATTTSSSESTVYCPQLNEGATIVCGRFIHGDYKGSPVVLYDFQVMD
jgi:hypothetical protein